MKILLLCYEYPPMGGGGGIGARQYAEAWAEKGHRVTVLTQDAPGLPRTEWIAGVEIIRVRTAGNRSRATATWSSMFAYLLSGSVYVLRHRHRLRRFDVINTHFSLPTGPLGWVASTLLSRPHVLTIIGGDIFDPTKKSSPHRHWYLRTVNRFLINSADHVVAISTDTRTRAQSLYGVRRPIQVINYGFKPPDHRAIVPECSRNENGQYRLISVGRLVARKGIPDLIRALGRLPADIVLQVVGDGPLEGELRRTAEVEGVSDRVEWLGYQPRERVHEYLRRADCFVLASLHEGLGIVVQEAMYAGLPIVSTNNGGQVDLIEPRCNGLLVDPERPAALAAAIHEVYRDPDLAEAMARNNRLKIEQYYMDRNCEAYLDIFQRVVRPSPALQTA